MICMYISSTTFVIISFPYKHSMKTSIIITIMKDAEDINLNGCSKGDVLKINVRKLIKHNNITYFEQNFNDFYQN